MQLRLSLRREASGKVALRLDMPVNENTLRSLLNGYPESNEKPSIFLTVEKGIPYGEVVKVIDMLNSFKLHKISLDTDSPKITP